MYLPTRLLIAGLTLTAALAIIQEPFLAPEPSTNVLTPQIDIFIEYILADWNSPGGIGIAVVRKTQDGGWNVETKGYGVAEADGSKVTEDTLFVIGSNSKLFDIIATGLLISNETLSPRLSWDTKISSIIPEWEMADPVTSSESTIIDLMSHRTGLPRHDLLYYGTSMSSLISKLKYLRPSAEFRETWQYNNLMYTTLSYLPQVLLKVPFARYVKEHIFRPLNLNSTTYSPDLAEESGKLASGFVRDQVNKTEDLFGMGVPRAMPFWNPTGGEDGNALSGAGGVISSARDVAIWLQTLLLEGKNPANNEQVIPSAVIRRVATGVTVVTGSASYPELAPIVYGGGQTASSYRGHNFIEHGGKTAGFSTQIIRFPFDNLGVAVLSNDDSYGPLLKEVIKWRIVDQVFGLEPVDWNSRYKTRAIESYEQELQSFIPRPVNSTPPSVAFSSLEGKYYNPAYGTLDLCGVPQTLGSSCKSNITAITSFSCKDLINELPTRLPGTINASVPTFFARLESELKLTVTHVRFQHFSGNLFNVSYLASIPLNDPAESTSSNGTQQYWVYPPGSADNGIAIEFATALDSDVNEDSVTGFGYTGDFWGAGAGVEGPIGETVQERAEVWYDRI